jgi:CHASE2 domain-containing sensor protein
MLRQLRPHHLHLGLLITSAVLVIGGLVALWAAVSFQGYISALLLLALAGCGFAGARDLAAKNHQARPTAGDSL